MKYFGEFPKNPQIGDIVIRESRRQGHPFEWKFEEIGWTCSSPFYTSNEILEIFIENFKKGINGKSNQQRNKL